MFGGILEWTEKVFRSISFEDLSPSWIKKIIDSEFTDATEADMATNLLFSEDPSQTLKHVGNLSGEWVEKMSKEALDATNDGEMSELPEDSFFGYLVSEMDISIEQIQGMIYFLSCKAVKSSASVVKRELGLLTARWYFNCLRIPGASMHKIYNINLFLKCLECIQIPDHDSKDKTFNWHHYERLQPTVALVLESLVPLIGEFHLGNDSSTVEYVMQKLSVLAGSEISKRDVNFDLDFKLISHRRGLSYSTIVTSLAYQGFLSLMRSEINGELEDIYPFALSQIKDHIVCSKIKKGSTIPVKYHVIKDNATRFMCYNLQPPQNDLISGITTQWLKRFVKHTPDRAEFRAASAASFAKVMFHLTLGDLVKMLKWVLHISRANEVGNRQYAIEMFHHLLENAPQVNIESLPPSEKVYFKPEPFAFALLTRCDDASPHVRAKALNVMSEHMRCVLTVVKEFKGTEEMFDDNKVYMYNGNHRRFWYDLETFEDRLEEIVAMFRRRCEDRNGMARKAAMQALEHVITFDDAYLTPDIMKLYKTTHQEASNFYTKKQTVHSLTAILLRYPENPLIQEYWLQHALAYVRDNDKGVQTRVLDVINDIFLEQMEKKETQKLPLQLLKRLSTDFAMQQRYLQYALAFWKKEEKNKLRPQMVGNLLKFLGGEDDEVIWLYISLFPPYVEIPFKVNHVAVEKLKEEDTWKDVKLAEHILKFLGAVIPKKLDKELLESIRDILVRRLEDYAVHIWIVSIVVDNLYLIELEMNDTADGLMEFATKMVETSMKHLEPLMGLNKAAKLPTEDMAYKSFAVMKEFCSHFPKLITENVRILLKFFVYKKSKRITTKIQSHALAAVGKICFTDETLARDVVPVLSKEIFLQKEDVKTHGSAIILADLCKRYTYYADQYIPLISTCFIHGRYNTRFSSLTIVISLLQEDYIKCKAPLFHALLVTVVDVDEEIRNLGRYALVDLLLKRKSNIFLDNFAESVFVLNNFQPPGEKAELARLVKDLEKFALPSDLNRDKRLQIYNFMLEVMDPKDKPAVIERLCDLILNQVAGQIYPLNATTQAMIGDVFAVLLSDRIKVVDAKMFHGQVDESDAKVVSDMELVYRQMSVAPVVAAIVQLNGVFNLTGNGLKLYDDILAFLKEFLFDFKDKVDEILAEDKELLTQVKFHLINETHTKKGRGKKGDPKLTVAAQQRRAAANATAASGNATSGDDLVSDVIMADTEAAQARASTSGASPSTSHAARDSDGNPAMDAESGAVPQSFQNDPKLTSTPRVVIQPLSRLDISRITPMDTD